MQFIANINVILNIFCKCEIFTIFDGSNQIFGHESFKYR